MCRYPLTLLIILSLSSPSSAEIDQQLFNRIVDTAMEQYQQEFRRHDQRLSIVAVWESDNVYANAWKMEDKNGETGLIQISGGFARHPDITPEAFALVLCHEIGHHIAGPPKIWKFSAEGQADYFGAADCLRKLFRRGVLGDEVGHVPRVVEKACADAYTIPEEQQICSRIALAGADLATYFARKRDDLMPKLSRRSEAQAVRTILVPATPQCRLDTYFAAALCNPSTDPTVEDKPWLCAHPAPEHVSNRPRCWLGENHLAMP